MLSRRTNHPAAFLDATRQRVLPSAVQPLQKGDFMLTSKDRAAINAANVGDVITLSDGRRIVKEHESKLGACPSCELFNEDCVGIRCGLDDFICRNERGI